MFLEQPHLQAFDTDSEIKVRQFGAEEHVHLVDVWQVEQLVQVHAADPGAGLLDGFATGGLVQGFAVFHETGGQGPEAAAWLDGAPAQQHLAAPGR
ncbi:hypothetical protein D3C81_965620 [compost metagenome]